MNEKLRRDAMYCIIFNVYDCPLRLQVEVSAFALAGPVTGLMQEMEDFFAARFGELVFLTLSCNDISL